jgi:hypothetical protein
MKHDGIGQKANSSAYGSIRKDARDRLPNVFTVQKKIGFINGIDDATWKQFSEPDTTSVAEIHRLTSVFPSQASNGKHLGLQIKPEDQVARLDHLEYAVGTAQDGCDFGQNRLGGVKRRRFGPENPICPTVVFVVAVQEGNQQTRVSDLLHAHGVPKPGERPSCRCHALGRIGHSKR